MMKMNRILRSAAALTLAALLALMPAALAAGSFRAVVTSSSMKVYGQSAPHSYLGSLPKGTTVTVNAYSGQAALISYKGRTGIARMSDMMAVAGDSVQPTPTPKPTESPAEKATSAEIAASKTMVTACATRVYKKASTSSKSVAVKAGVKVNLLAVKNGVARVERNGVVGYMYASHLAEPTPVIATPAPTATPKPETEVVTYDNVPVMTTGATRVYAKPSTSSASVTVSKGTRMTLVATKGACAMVKKGGQVGYVAKSMLTTEITPEATPTPTPTPTPAPAKTDDGKYTTGTNQQIVFRFLVNEAGYNAAAACGVMANIRYESGFKPTSGGDGGTSYGIVQWHGSRKTRLINWCKKNGYDYTTLKGQLYFLLYELKTYYPSVHNKLKSVPNTDQGAYDAAYDFCYRFESPTNKASRSVTRGNYARDTLWPKYKT